MGEWWDMRIEDLKEYILVKFNFFFNSSGGFPRERKLIKQGQVFCRLKGDIIVVCNIRSVVSTGIISIRFVPER